MSTKTAIAAIRLRLETEWVITPICFPKEDFTPPQPSTDAPYGCWLFFDPDDSLEGRVGMGSVNNPRGFVNIHVMTPADGGDEHPVDLRDQLSDLFGNKQFSGVQTDVVANISNSGSSEDGVYSTSTVRIEWGHLHRR